jgi:pyruvate/2-oxoglutarate/acetoin dehydrogenase E1 component/TPP-dependent pyruvate/acetoin dehydrogenase alpha subunit
MIYRTKEIESDEADFERQDVLEDYRLAYESRQASLIGRREVLSGKAKFGIFGDGKEVAQIALAKCYQPGDFRSGYYRDQTLAFVLGMSNIQEFFAQLYAHADVAADPATAGRSMNAHFATRLLDDDGRWRPQTEMYNTSADLSPTASQMPRLVGLGYASKLYRELEVLQGRPFTDFSHNGDEVAFGMIGNASCAEGMFWESVNAIGVLKTPVVLSIWDDGYGISVPNEYQVVKSDIGEILQGFQRQEGSCDGYDIYIVKAWDYPALIETYRQATETARREHVPSIIHVTEVTQPQGHSTSGSHERYKTKERLAWEVEYDCITKMREWIIAEGLATAEELDEIEEESQLAVENIRITAWEAYIKPIREERQDIADILDELSPLSSRAAELEQIKKKLLRVPTPGRKHIMAAVYQSLAVLRDENIPAKSFLIEWKDRQNELAYDRYNSHLYSESDQSAMNVEEIKPVYSDNSSTVNGFEIMNACFDAMLGRDPRVVAFGEDVGYLGDVNQGFAGLQEKYGPLRVSDTGIRETTIIGQGIGLAIRGLRPIAELQYLDYILYALQIISDDLATLHWRTKGGQKAPLIIRTRGHRLEGIWHSGSLMAGLIHLIRGVRVLVPRDMTRAAGFYNTMLQSDEPGVIVEVLNGYRVKEKLPDNIGEMTVPLGVPEILREGADITLVTYGACCRIVMEAAEMLQEVGIDAEVIDVQSLLPFDIHGIIGKSLEKTGHVIFIDEDVPGGTTAYMLQEVMEKQGGFWMLDSEPRTLPGQPHRPAYGSDGDYWSKPNTETIFEAAYEIMNEVDPAAFPIFYK